MITLISACAAGILRITLPAEGAFNLMGGTEFTVSCFFTTSQTIHTKASVIWQGPEFYKKGSETILKNSRALRVSLTRIFIQNDDAEQYSHHLIDVITD